MAGMLSVDPRFRGVASGFQTMILMFGQILSLITLFGVLTHSVDEVQLFNIFLYGGGGASIFECFIFIYVYLLLFLYIILWIFETWDQWQMHCTRATSSPRASCGLPPPSTSSTTSASRLLPFLLPLFLPPMQQWSDGSLRWYPSHNIITITPTPLPSLSPTNLSPYLYPPPTTHHPPYLLMLKLVFVLLKIKK